MMMKKILTAALTLLVVNINSFAQSAPSDTVIVNVANSSKIIFTVKDRSDLNILKHYDFQALFEDIIQKIEDSDSTLLYNDTLVIDEEDEIVVDIEEPEHPTIKESAEDHFEAEEEGRYNEGNHTDYNSHWYRKHWGRTWQSFNFDIGTNNYLSDGSFPDDDNQLYTVRPWGSWYVGINSVQRTRLGKKTFLEWGFGVSWYNFKFQKDNILIGKNDEEVLFNEDPREFDFIKSKLTVSYINAFLVPVYDFTGYSKKPRVWDGYHESFRIGLGPYFGYRLGSHSKLVYEEGGSREKDKERDNFYLENLRYGLRLQLGFRATDIFINYDLNELFVNDRGPSLNAFSFGLIF